MDINGINDHLTSKITETTSANTALDDQDNISTKTFSYYSLTPTIKSLSSSSSSSSSTTSYDDCMLNQSIYNDYMENLDINNKIIIDNDQMMKTSSILNNFINFDDNDKMENLRDNHRLNNENSSNESIIKDVFCKIETLLYSKYINYNDLFIDFNTNDNDDNHDFNEFIIENDDICEYICLIQQLHLMNNEKVGDNELCNNRSNANNNQIDQNVLLKRLSDYCIKILMKYPNFIVVFLKQMLINLSSINDNDDNVNNINNLASIISNNSDDNNQLIEPNLYFSNINSFYSNENKNTNEIPITDKESHELLEWLYPNYELIELFEFIDKTCHRLSNDLFGEFNINKNNFKKLFPKQYYHNHANHMPLIDNLLSFIFNNNYVAADDDENGNSTSLNTNSSYQNRINRNSIKFCLRATIFEQLWNRFQNWYIHNNIDNDLIDNRTEMQHQQRQQHSFEEINFDIINENSNKLCSKFIVKQLYQLAIDLTILCLSYNHFDLVYQFLTLHISDFDLTKNFKQAMNAINYELDNEINIGIMNNLEFRRINDDMLMFTQPQLQEQQQQRPIANSQTSLYDIDIEFDDINNKDDDDDLENKSVFSDQSSKKEHDSMNNNDKHLDRSEIFHLKRQLLEKIRLNSQKLEAPINNRWSFGECCICYEKCWLLKRKCCQHGVCLSCLQNYYTERIRMGELTIECIGPNCKSLIYRSEIMLRLTNDNKSLYCRLLLNKSSDSDRIRPCPRCNRLYTLSDEQQNKMKNIHQHLFLKRLFMCSLRTRSSIKESKIFKVKCDSCDYDWCFHCHSPWHEGNSCDDYIRGDRLLKTWAKHSDSMTGSLNAQKCPRCKIYIQRINGCDHMHCIRCKSDFCYRCGDRIRHARFFGNHYSRFSVFGCKYRYKPKNPVQRKLVRGAVLGSKIIVLPLLTAVCLCTGVVVISVGIASMPIIGGLYFYNYIRNNKRNNSIIDLYINNDYGNDYMHQTSTNQSIENISTSSSITTTTITSIHE